MNETSLTTSEKPEESRFGLRLRMLLIIAIAGIPGIIVAFSVTIVKLVDERSQIEYQTQLLASIGAAQHEVVLANARTLLEAVRRTQKLGAISDADCETYLDAWADRLLTFTSLTLFDPRGQVVCKNINGQLPFAASDQTWFDKAKKEGRFVLSDYVIGRNGAPLLIAAQPILSDNLETIGVLAIGISLRWLDFISDTVELPASGTITALGPRGELLTHNSEKSGKSEESSKFGPSPSAAAIKAIIHQRGSGVVRAKDQGGVTRLYGFERTDHGGITVVVGMPQFLEYAEWGTAVVDTILPPLMVLIIALLAAGWASEILVTRHVRSLIGTTRRIIAGEFDARTAVDYDEHEIGQLAATLDTMAETIEVGYERLRKEMLDQKMVADEMMHRVNNNLALVGSVARQTLRHSDNNIDFERRFTDRLKVLAASNAVLARGDWRSADLEKLLGEILSVHCEPSSGRLTLDGEKVRLTPRATMALSMTLHELATNSVKHGALAEEGGGISIAWSIIENGDERRLKILWRERVECSSADPAEEGFGSRLIRRMIEGQLGGSVEWKFASNELICSIEFPWHAPEDDKVVGASLREGDCPLD